MWGVLAWKLTWPRCISSAERREPERRRWCACARMNAPRRRVLRGGVAGHPCFEVRSLAEFEAARVKCCALISSLAADLRSASSVVLDFVEYDRKLAVGS